MQGKAVNSKLGVSQPSETCSDQFDSIEQIEEILNKNRQTYKSNDSNNCSFEDADLESELNTVEDNLSNCEPDKKEKQLRNKQILDERKRLLAIKKAIQERENPQDNQISIDDQILKLFKENDIESISQLYEDIEDVKSRIQRYTDSKRSKALKDAQNELELYNNILEKHAQLVKPKIQNLLDDLGLNNIEEALEHKEFLDEELMKVGPSKAKKRQQLQEDIDKINEILEIVGRPNSKPQPISEPIQKGDFRNINQSDQHQEEEKKQQVSEIKIVENTFIPSSQVDVESFFHREKEDAQNNAGFINSAPDSFEKSVKILIHILYQKLEKNIKPSDWDAIIQVKISSYDDLIKTHLQNIKVNFIEEVIKNNNIIAKLEQIEEPTGSNEQYQRMLESLKQIQPLISTFSFQEFFSYVEKANQVANKLNDTEIVLLLGTTGAGKSTTIHYICGSEMKKTLIDNKLQHIAYENVVNEDLLMVKVSPFSRSETRYIRPIKIKIGTSIISDGFTLVDTPGLFDLKNAEVDVSNQIGIINALQQVKSVKPFIVLSYKKIGPRGEDLKKILNFYCQMVTHSDHLEKFNFFFSHVDPDVKITNLTARIADIYNQLNVTEKQNELLVEFLKIIINKAENNKLFIIDPLDSKKIPQILSDIKGSSKITSPSQSFKKVVSQESYNKIIEQFGIHSKQILSQFKRAQGKNVEYMISELQKFCEIMDSDRDYKLKLNEILHELSKRMNEKYNEVIKIFETLLKHGNNSVEDQEIRVYQSNIQFMVSLEDLRIKYLCKIDESSIETHSYQDLEDGVQKVIKSAYEEIKKPPLRLDSYILHDYLQKLEILENYKEKIEVFTKIRKEIFTLIFKDLQIISQKAESFLINVTSNLDQDFDRNSNLKPSQISSLIEENKQNEIDLDKKPFLLIDEFCNLLGELERAEQISKNSLKTKISDQIQKIETSLTKKFDKIISYYFEDFSQMNLDNLNNISNLDEEDLNSLKTFTMTEERVKKIQKYYQLLECFLKSMNQFDLSQKFIGYIEEKHTLMNKQLNYWCTVLEIKFKRKINYSNKYSAIKQIYDELMLGQILPSLQSQANRQNRIKMNLTKLVSDKTEEAKKHMSMIEQIVNQQYDEEGKPKDNKQISIYTLKSLKQAISTINDLQWTVQQGNQEFYKELKSELEANLNRLILVIEESVKLSKENNSSVSEITQTENAFKQINEIQLIGEIIDIKLPPIKIEEFIPDIEYNLDNAETFLIKKGIIQINEIQEESKDQIVVDPLLRKSECKKFSKFYDYLNILKKKDFMIQKIDEINGSKEKAFFNRIDKLTQAINKFVKQQIEKVKFEFKTCLDLMNKFLDKIKQLNVDKDGFYQNREHEILATKFLDEFLVNPVERIIMIFQMIRELKRNHSQICKKIFPNDDFENEELKQPLEIFYRKVNTDIAKVKDNQVQVTNNLYIINQMIPLDVFIHEQNEKKINRVQEQYDKHFLELINFQANVVKTVQELITNQNYEEIKETLIKLQQLDRIDQKQNFRKVLDLVHKQCNLLRISISKEIKFLRKGQALDPEVTERINSKSIELEEILKIIGDKLIDEIIFTKAQKELSYVKSRMVSNFVDLQNLIDSQISGQSFNEAFNSILNYNLSAKKADFANSSQDNEDSKETEDQKEDPKDSISEIEKLKQKLEQAIKDQIEKFNKFKAQSQQDPDDDSILNLIIENSAKEIIENLESNTLDPQFKNYAKQIKDSIIFILDPRMHKLHEKVLDFRNNCDELSQKIRFYLNFCLKLPQDLNQKYLQTIKDLQKKFEDDQAKESSQIWNFIGDSTKTLEQIYQKIMDAKFRLNAECKNELNQQYQYKIKILLIDIKEKQLPIKIQSKLKEFWLFQSNEMMKKHLDEQSNSQYQNLLEIIQTIYRAIIKRIEAIFQNKESQIEFQIKIQDKEYNFQIHKLSWFIELRNNYIIQAEEILPDLEKNILDLLENAMLKLVEYQTEFQKQIQSDDPTILSGLFNIIICMRKLAPAQDLLTSLSQNQVSQISYGMSVNKREQSQIYGNKLKEFIILSESVNKKAFCTQITKKFITIQGVVMTSQFINTQTLNNDQERKEFYDKLEKQYSFIQKSIDVKQDLFECDIDADRVKNDCEKKFQENYKDIEDQAVYLINQKLGHMKSKDFKDLHNKFENLKIIQQKFKAFVPQNFVQIKHKAQMMINQSTDYINRNLCNKNIQCSEISGQLIISQDIVLNVAELVECAQQSIQDILDNLQKNSKDQSHISEIALMLKKSPVGLIIVEKQPIFICEQRKFWAEKVNRQDIEYVLENLMKDQGKTKITPQEKIKLKEQYDIFDKKYKYLVENTIAPYDNIPQNKDQLKSNLIKLTEQSRLHKIDMNQMNQLSEILANLFALWTISDFHTNKLKHPNNTRPNEIPYLLKPHPSQVVSILRILGNGYEKVNPQDQSKLNDLKKIQVEKFLSKKDIIFDNLVQIKTGEGKSITLAIVISVFALFDFEVSCACYSQYLSIRDFQQFNSLFQFLGIKDKIYYGTFNQICERYINKDGDIRQLVLNKILKDSQISKNQKENEKKRVILIDEVDVFFSKDFFNKVYVPVAQIKNEKVSNLLDFMWEIKDDKSITLNKLRSSKQYIECSAIFKPEFIGILDEACKDMFYAAQNYLSHDYVVQNNKIGYQDMDQISFTKSYGYNTIFAHYYHQTVAKNGQKVSQQNLENSKGIEIHCGQFSYAEIPLQSMLILGVTGTLDSLTETENKIIKKVFQIQNFTYSPSVYGENKLLWEQVGSDRRLLILNQSDYYNRLGDQIKVNMQGGNCQRAVLVFFKTYDLLKKFQESHQYQNLTCEKQELFELLGEKEKENVIIQATYQNTLTLTTRSFGRGTDFICRDDKVDKDGGIHVILTFVPESHSEFVQIQGRTARQGNHGSFQMILLDTDLQSIDVNVESKEYNDNLDNKLGYIFQQRNKKMLQSQKSDTKAVKQIRSAHQKAIEIRDILLKDDNSQSESLCKYLIKINQGPSMKVDDKPVKTLILMDATGSMSSLLVEAKNSVNLMFERAGKILEDHKLDPNLFMIQFACYRNYSSEKLILQNSQWQFKAEQLKQFMELIDVSGGMGNEAIEIGFQHAVREAQECGNIPLRQVYLIGDMPPNTKGEVESRRNLYQFWKGTKFEQPVYWETELAKLKQMNVKVHTFYLKPQAKQSFDDIAMRTGGKSCFLDVSQANSQEILLNHQIPKILEIVGEVNGDTKLGQKLVAEYLKCYKQ